MTNYTGMSKSNYVEVENKEALQLLIDQAFKAGAVSASTYWTDGLFALGQDSGPMYIEEDYLDPFLTLLGKCIDETMVIRSVGYEGMRYQPDAWQWVVHPDGSWEYESLEDH